MKLIRALLLSLALVNPALAADYVAGTPSAGQSPGTTTNDNAVAGNVGEYQVSGCPAASNTATVTFTGTTTNLVVWATNAEAALCPVSFTNSGGGVPSGISASTTYYVTNNASLTSASFQISTTVANAIAGTALSLTSNGTGTNTGTSVASVVSNGAFAAAPLSLTAGDWDVECIANILTASTTVVSNINVTVGTSATALAPVGGAYSYIGYSGTGATGLEGGFLSLPTRVSVAATTEVYCEVQAGFITSTMTASGLIRARRVR